MTLNEFALVVPALQRRAHNTWIAVERERARTQGRPIKARRRPSRFESFRRALELGADLMFTLWALAAVAFCLIVACGFLL